MADTLSIGKVMIRTTGMKVNSQTEICTVRAREYSKTEELKKEFLRWVNSQWPKTPLLPELYYEYPKSFCGLIIFVN